MSIHILSREMYGSCKELDAFIGANFGTPGEHSNYLVKKRQELYEISENFVYIFAGVLRYDGSHVVKVGFSKSYPFANDETSIRSSKTCRLKEHMAKDYESILPIDFFANVSRNIEERFHVLCKKKYPHFCRGDIRRDKDNTRTKIKELYRPEFLPGIYSVLREFTSGPSERVMFDDPAKNEIMRALTGPDWKSVVRRLIESKKRKFSDVGFGVREPRRKRVRVR